MDTVRHLDDVVELMREHDEAELYVRWSADIAYDVRSGTSRDELTGVELPGLSVNSLHVEPWWDGRPLKAWVARRLYDYRHLQHKHGPDTRPWILAGRERARGPDNEPLITDCVVIAEVALDVIEEAQRQVDGLGGDWGTLDRSRPE